MMKITNLNFQNQTIEKIELDCENFDNVEIKLTKTKVEIKEVVEPVVEPVTEVIEEELVTKVIEE